MADSVWSCKEKFGSACKGLPADKKHEGKQYCVLHFPSSDKDLAAFEGAIEKKLKDKDFDFRGIYFPANAASFSNFTFEGWTDFTYATFEGEASFLEATFEGRTYFKATFEGKTYLDNAIFKEVGKFWSLRTSSQTVLSFRSAVIEKPERLSFHSTHLRPSWFIDVDAKNSTSPMWSGSGCPTEMNSR